MRTEIIFVIANADQRPAHDHIAVRQCRSVLILLYVLHPVRFSLGCVKVRNNLCRDIASFNADGTVTVAVVSTGAAAAETSLKATYTQIDSDPAH